MADLVEVYYLEHVKKVNEVDDYFYQILKYSFENGEQTRMESLIDRVIEYVSICSF